MTAVAINARTTASDIAALVRSRKLSAREVAEDTLQRIARNNSALNAFTDVTARRLRAEADAVDTAIAAGRDPGPLAGVPFAVKNLFDIEGLPTRAGSKINREHAPAQADATLIERLRAGGALLAGGLNMGEYAYDFTGRNAHDGPSRNPHDLERMSGGSSGGSGSAVGGGLVPIALGSDTNGSIRVPSSLCGTFGLKPTFGRLSRGGSFMFVASLDHLGPLARSVTDLALSYDAMQGADERDPVCAPPAIEPALPHLEDDIADLRIAIAGDYFAKGAQPEAFEAVATVAKALAADRRVTLPEAARARAAAFLITSAEGANLHRERLRTRAADFDPETRDRFLAGCLLPAGWYVQAQRFRRWYRARLLELFMEVDVILAPATPCTAPHIEQTTMELGGQIVPVRANMGIFTQPISFVGLPVVAVPIQRVGGLPIGVQVIAAPWNEIVALRVARRLEREGIASAVVPERFVV